MASALAASRLTTSRPASVFTSTAIERRPRCNTSNLTSRPGSAEVGGLPPVDADHLGPHVGQQHGGERRRPDAGHLDDAISAERAHWRAFLA